MRHLIDAPEQAYGEPGESAAATPREIDRRVALQDLLTPLPADSSQLAAVVAASEGRDLVLIGPPGTGKSQTIANMIAQFLGHGQTVLFVAEKAAALDVVHRRLVACGLGDAVLELHSNKTERKSVIAQLGSGWERASEATEAQWIEITNALQLSRDQLNTYVEVLHAKGSQGFSVFEAVGLAAAGKAPFAVTYPSQDAHDAESYKRLLAFASELGRTHAVVANGPALSLIRTDEWSYRWEAEILEAAETLGHALGCAEAGGTRARARTRPRIRSRGRRPSPRPSAGACPAA